MQLNGDSLRFLKNSQFTCIKFKAIKSFKYFKWYKKSLNYNFEEVLQLGTERQEPRYSLIKLQKAMMSLNKYERCTFQSQNAAQMSVCECVSEGNSLSSETCRWHFHYILPIMPDKASRNIQHQTSNINEHLGTSKMALLCLVAVQVAPLRLCFYLFFTYFWFLFLHT